MAGSLLLSHPEMEGDDFRRGVVYLSAHTHAEGALGFILNAPWGKVLGDMLTDFAYGPLSQVPLFRGGPVQPEQLMFAALDFAGDGPFMRFGIEETVAENLVISGSAHTQVRAFLGYSGWTAGQLESELMRDTWIVAEPDRELMRTLEGEALWRALTLKAKPELAYLLDAPEDPSLN